MFINFVENGPNTTELLWNFVACFRPCPSFFIDNPLQFIFIAWIHGKWIPIKFLFNWPRHVYEVNCFVSWRSKWCQVVFHTTCKFSVSTVQCTWYMNLDSLWRFGMIVFNHKGKVKVLDVYALQFCDFAVNYA